MDKIRLLGNGVVPQCAAKAWQVLDKELCDHCDDEGFTCCGGEPDYTECCGGRVLCNHR